MTNEITIYEKIADPIDAAIRMGKIFSASGMFGCQKEEQGQVLAMICLAERKSPVDITRDYDIVEGKLRKKALAALANFRTAGGKHVWLASGDEPASTEEARFASLKLTDRDSVSVTYTYSMADARQEGLIKDKSRWTKRPGNMLRARCISNGLGMIAPEIFAGYDEPQGGSEPATVTASDPPKLFTEKPTKTEPPIQDAEIVDEKEEAKAGLAPETKPEAATAQPPTDFMELESVLAKQADKVNAWLLKNNWIKPGQTFKNLQPRQIKKILERPDAFMRALDGGAK